MQTTIRDNSLWKNLASLGNITSTDFNVAIAKYVEQPWDAHNLCFKYNLEKKK